MRRNVGLRGAGQEAEAVWDLPFLYRAGDVGEEPGDQGYHQYAGHDLGNPLDNLGVPPNRDALVC